MHTLFLTHFIYLSLFFFLSLSLSLLHSLPLFLSFSRTLEFARAFAPNGEPNNVEQPPSAKFRSLCRVVTSIEKSRIVRARAHIL